jgi:hypothetical protein
MRLAAVPARLVSHSTIPAVSVGLSRCAQHVVQHAAFSERQEASPVKVLAQSGMLQVDDLRFSAHLQVRTTVMTLCHALCNATPSMSCSMLHVGSTTLSCSVLYYLSLPILQTSVLDCKMLSEAAVLRYDLPRGEESAFDKGWLTVRFRVLGARCRVPQFPGVQSCASDSKLV